jgi:polyhydroxyalkanoate synthesis repressor PhaR
MRAAMDRNPIVIKKYENRRLYDTTNSRYINQDEVAQMLRDGRDVQVVDAATGEDLTRLVLTQIIVEQAKTPGSAFPLDILRQMVMASNRATQESTLTYMKAMMDMYQNAYRTMAPPMNPFEFMAGPPARAGAAESVPTPASGKRDGGEVDELKRRVAELESLVSKRGAEKGSAKKGKKKKASPGRRG